jgi:hypothetical protein
MSELTKSAVNLAQLWPRFQQLYRSRAAVRAGTALASGALTAATTPYFLPHGADKATARNMAAKNFVLGVLIGYPGLTARARGGAATLGLLTNAGFGMAERNVMASEGISRAQTEDTAQAMASRAAAIRASEAQANAAASQAAASRQVRNAALILGTGITGAMAYSLWRDKQQHQRRLWEAQRAGNIRVTLPTPEGDTESVVEIPLIRLPESTQRGVMRDTRRRLREETELRTQRKSPVADTIRDSSSFYDRFTLPA